MAEAGDTSDTSPADEYTEAIRHWRGQISTSDPDFEPASPTPLSAPTAAELAALPDELIEVFMDWWAVGNPSASSPGYSFWHGELQRRAEERLTASLVEATKDVVGLMASASAQNKCMLSLTERMESLTRQVKWWTVVNGVIAAAAVIVAVIALALTA